MKKVLSVVFCLFVFSIFAKAQAIKIIPDKYLFPKDYDKEVDPINYDLQLKERGKATSKDNGNWFIISDRQNNKVYADPKENATVITSLKFKEYAYVMDDGNEDWLKIAKGRVTKGKIESPVWEGWIQKENVVISPWALVNKTSNIHTKAFLLNQASNIAEVMADDNWQLAKIYDGPNSVKEIDQRGIYEFYFILKRANNRVLIAKDYFTRYSETEKQIIGWIDESKLDFWPTRIALEPNFEEAAFDERKNNRDLRVLGFTNVGAANNFAKFGKVVQEQILWDQDPVTLPDGSMSEANPRRLNGQVIRFPMLKKRDKSYRSGVIGEITTKNISSMLDQPLEGVIQESDFGGLQEIVRSANEKRTNMNVFFLIEGTRSMAKNKTALINSIEFLDKNLPDYVNVKFGASIYRDLELRDQGRDLILSKLSPDKDEVVSFINDAEYDNFGDLDDWTNLRYGLEQSLVKGGFTTDYSNVVIIIGNHADFVLDKSRKAVAKMLDSGKYMPKRSAIEKLAAQYEVNFVVLQPTSFDSQESIDFGYQTRGIIENLASRLYQGLFQLKEEYPGLDIPPFVLPDVNLEETKIKLNNSAVAAYLYKPALGGSISAEEMEGFINESLKDCQNKYEELYLDISDLIENGQGIDFDISNGMWEPAIAHVINKSILDAKTKGKFSEDATKKLVNRKYKLFNEVYLPNKLPSADHPLFSYVVFMPEVDFVDYLRTLKDLKAATMGSLDKQREELYFAFFELLKKFSGENISKKEMESTNVDVLRSLMQGLSTDGDYFIGDKLNFNIGDLRNDKKINDAKISEIVNRILTKLESLESIAQQGDSYPFIFSSKENFKYYWLPADFLF